MRRRRQLPADWITRRQRRAMRRQHGPVLAYGPQAGPAVFAASPSGTRRAGLVDRMKARVARRVVDQALTSPQLAPVVTAAAVVVVAAVCIGVLVGAVLAEVRA